MDLHIVELSSTSFQIAGAGVWAISGHKSSLFYLAPFELEFYFKSLGDLDAKQVVVRFGAIDQSGEIKRVPYSSSSAAIVRNRPTSNSEWAFAIELS